MTATACDVCNLFSISGNPYLDGGLSCISEHYKECCYLAAGYCQITCGTCNCTSTISQVLTQLQANMFMQAAEMSGMKAQFDLPGFTATILAPSDAAFTTFLNGTASQCVELLFQSFGLHTQMLLLAPAPAPAPAPGPHPMPLPLGPVLIPAHVCFYCLAPSCLPCLRAVHRGRMWHMQALQQPLVQGATCSLRVVCRMPCFTSKFCMCYSSSVVSCFAWCLQMPPSLLHMLLQAL